MKFIKLAPALFLFGLAFQNCSPRKFNDSSGASEQSVVDRKLPGGCLFLHAAVDGAGTENWLAANVNALALMSYRAYTYGPQSTSQTAKKKPVKLYKRGASFDLHEVVLKDNRGFVFQYEPQAWSGLGTPGTLDHSGGVPLQVVVFRGTTGPADWLTDLNLFLTAPGNHGMDTGEGNAHLGFVESANAAYDDVKANLKHDTSRPVLLAGHSLGGAVATIVANRLLSDGYNVLGVYSYGAPKIGDEKYAHYLYDERLKGKIYRVVARGDIVPQTPFDEEHIEKIKKSAFGEELSRRLLLSALTDVMFSNSRKYTQPGPVYKEVDVGSQEQVETCFDKGLAYGANVLSTARETMKIEDIKKIPVPEDFGGCADTHTDAYLQGLEFNTLCAYEK